MGIILKGIDKSLIAGKENYTDEYRACKCS